MHVPGVHVLLRGCRRAKGTKIVAKLSSVSVSSDQKKNPRKEQGTCTSLNDRNINSETEIESGTPRLR